MKNGKDIGCEYLATLDAYLNEGGLIPRSIINGALNLTEMSRITHIPKSTFYQNPAVRSRLDEARIAQCIPRWGDVAKSPDVKFPSVELRQLDQSILPDSRAKQLLERKLYKLEQQNSSLVAENFELRQDLKQLRLQMGREDMMIETGRRISVPQSAR